MQFTIQSILWLLACLALGLGYAALLYRGLGELGKQTRLALSALRVLAVAVIAWLLFSPLIRTVNTTREKPLVIIAQDNSASISLSKPTGFNASVYANNLQKLEEELGEKYEVRTLSFGDAVKPGLLTRFNESVTDMSAVFKSISDQFSNRNIGAVIVAGDGIYNRGANPLYDAANLGVSVYTVGLGDTIPRRDLLIANVNYNNIAYLDNQFQTEITVEAYQTAGSSSLLTVSDRNGVVFSKPITVSGTEFRTTVPITLLAKTKGIQQYTIRIAPIGNELSLQNNTQTIFVEVVDGRQKVLLLAAAPHPDLTAIRHSVETSKNYTAKVVMAGEETEADIRDAGLIILHQLPATTNNAQQILKLTAGKPLLYILGNQSNVNAFSQAQALLGITSTGSTQEVTASFQPDFYAFTLAETTRQRVSGFAPLISPFGNYGLKGPGNILIGQQVGKLATKMPLLVFGDDAGRKIGVLAGEGIWRWRLEDFQENGSHQAIDELITKTVQYLSSKDDHRKFRVYPAKTAFDENERVVLNAELYNDAFELVNTPDVNINLNNRNGKNYSFVFSRTANTYTLDAGILTPGEYTFTARTSLGKQNHIATGQFTISQQLAEYRQTRADHQLLYTMAKQTGGVMVMPDQLSSLVKLLEDNENVKTVAYEDRRYDEVINLKVIFFVILALLSIEWFTRKRNGQV